MPSKILVVIRTAVETTWEEDTPFPRIAMSLDFKTVDLLFLLVFVTFDLSAVPLRMASMRHSHMLYTNGPR